MAGLFISAASAQTTLPEVKVTSAPYETHHGGYLISGNFKVDPRMPGVVFPAQALVRDDILSVHPVNLADDEYLVLQECAAADCSLARIVRVWDSDGAVTPVGNSEDRVWITHENKYFIWLKRLPYLTVIGCAGCGSHFTSFQRLSPPLTLIPGGRLAAYAGDALRDAERRDPLPVVSQKHDGSNFVITYAGGSTVWVKRMHAAH